jgi:hypothetical protein
MKIVRLSGMSFRFTAENTEDIAEAFHISHKLQRGETYTFDCEGKKYSMLGIDHETFDSDDLNYLVTAVKV